MRRLLHRQVRHFPSKQLWRNTKDSNPADSHHAASCEGPPCFSHRWCLSFNNCGGLKFDPTNKVCGFPYRHLYQVCESLSFIPHLILWTSREKSTIYHLILTNIGTLEKFKNSIEWVNEIVFWHGWRGESTINNCVTPDSGKCCREKGGDEKLKEGPDAWFQLWRGRLLWRAHLKWASKNNLGLFRERRERRKVGEGTRREVCWEGRYISAEGTECKYGDISETWKSLLEGTGAWNIPEKVGRGESTSPGSPSRLYWGLSS